MKKNNLLLWQTLFITSLLIANVVTGKVVLLFGRLVVPAAVVAYAITFLATDIINELYGMDKAQEIVKFGFVAQVLASVLIYLAALLPVAPFMPEMQKSFMMVLGQNARFVFASLTAYLVSQTHDVYSFNWWRKRTNGKHKWVRNNLSTMVSQIIDTAIFITIAFWGTVPNLWAMIVSQYIVKWCLALLDTPFFYLVTRKGKGHGKTEQVNAGSAKTIS